MTDQQRKIAQLRQAYRAAFDMTTFAGKLLMDDLAIFCFDDRPTSAVNRVTGSIDPIASGIAEGRREVLLRIKQFLRPESFVSPTAEGVDDE